MTNPKSSLFIALLAAGFAYHPSNSKAPPSAAASSNAPERKVARTVTYDKQLEVKDWPLLTIRQSFGDDAEASRLMGASKIQFIVATVPDPQNSHYPLVFDRLVESIQRGLEVSNLMLDRFWLPWDSEPGPIDEDFVMHEQHQEWFALKQSSPGVLVFRLPKSKNRLCVLIVGETPATGVNRAQFGNAMKIIDQLSSGKEIEILGPTFSGSIESLGEAMAGVQRDHSFNVVTGTATAEDNAGRLLAAAPGFKIDYERSIGTDNKAIDFFIRYAKEKSFCNQIGFLSESGTKYGQDVRTKVGNSGCEIQNFQYPMQISRMRDAYGKDPELQALSQTKIGDTPRQGLAIPVKDEHEGEDLVPTFSPDLRPISQEASILNVMASISYSHIQAIGIVATDVLDSLFLGRLLKEHCPNVRPFILNSDLLYGHASQNNAFDGMLMITNYPLIRKPDEFYNSGMPRQRDAPQFSSATEEGEYWATLRLLSKMKVGEKSVDRPVDSPWIAVMGRDGIWPITEPVNSKIRSLPQPAPSQSLGWKLFFSLASIFCLGFAGAIIYFNSKIDSEHLPFGWLAALRVCTRDARMILTLACLLLIAAYAFVALIELRSQPGFLHLGWAACAITFLALFAAVQCCWTGLRRSHLALFVLAAILFCVEIKYGAPPHSPAFVYRTLHVGDGVSPIVPIAFLTAALLWLACSNLNRIRLFHLFPETSHAFDHDPFLHHASELHSNLAKIVGQWSTGHYAWAAGVGTILFFSMVLFNPARILSLETFHFEWIYAAGLYVLYFGLLLESLRFLRAWSTLHGILHMLERHAICEVFCRLPNELSPSYLWRWGAAGPNFLVLAHFLNRLKSLSDQQLDRFVDRTYVEHLRQLQGDAKKLSCLISAARLIEAGTITTANKHLAQVYAVLVNAMSEKWGTAHLAPAQHEGAAAAAAAAAGIVLPEHRHPHRTPAGALLDETKPIAEEMIALRFVELIAQVNRQLKNNLEFIAGGLILAVISLNSYPFEPHHSMTSVMTIYFFGVSAAFLLVFMQMSRNTIISYLNNTTPGKLDGNIFHLLSMGGLPFLAVVSSQFPSIGGFIFAWVKPALETLH